MVASDALAAITNAASWTAVASEARGLVNFVPPYPFELEAVERPIEHESRAFTTISDPANA
nr:hypothetical protein [Brevibacterium sp.]